MQPDGNRLKQGHISQGCREQAEIHFTFFPPLFHGLIKIRFFMVLGKRELPLVSAVA